MHLIFLIGLVAFLAFRLKAYGSFRHAAVDSDEPQMMVLLAKLI
jgi:hypothetical protein